MRVDSFLGVDRAWIPEIDINVRMEGPQDSTPDLMSPSYFIGFKMTQMCTLSWIPFLQYDNN